MSRFLPMIVALVPFAGLTGCGSPSSTAAQKASPPAKVEKPVKEADLASVTLTPDAEQRLGIRLAKVNRSDMARTRRFGGEVIVPPGRSVVLSAPLTATVRAAANSDAPTPGRLVKKGQPLFELEPLLSPPDRIRLAETLVTLAGSRVDAEGQVEKARAHVEAANIALARAEQLVRDRAGSAKAVDEAKAQLSVAEAELKAAEARRDLLVQTTLDAEVGSLQPLPIVSPDDGLVQNVHTLPGQVVSAGSPLLEIIRHDLVWIRVPIYVGYLSTIALDQEANVGELADSAKTTHTARPVAAPPSANSTSATVDLFYELENPHGSLRPGQRLSVTLRLLDEEESLTVPTSSVLYDIHGNSWVYEQTGPQTFVRRRVQVRHVVDSLAVLAKGPPPGTEIVTDGAAELFGTELGFAK